TANVLATLTATLGNTWKDALLPVNRAGVKEISVSPSSIMLGQSATGTVTLTGPAPGGNVQVKLIAGDKLTVQGQVSVSAGSRTATFPIATRVGPDVASYVVTADLNGTQNSTVLKIEPTQLSELLMSPSTLPGGTAGQGILNLG